MRLRIIEQTAAYVKEHDPHTALTKTALRRLVTTGAIPSVRVGNKYLVDLEALESLFNSESADGGAFERVER